MSPKVDPLLVAIVGPTASGKTALSLALASRFGGEIVNCDSVAVYREFEIGTAKPSAEESTCAPHHLIDILDPIEIFTAGDYSRRARAVLEDIKSRGKLPIVVGGTRPYLRALLEGLAPGPQRSDEIREELRERVARKGSAHLHKILVRLDRAAAERIHPNDTSKLMRAVEVCLTARQPMTEVWKQGSEPLAGFNILRIGLDPQREALYARINTRATKMFECGLVEETRTLYEKYGDTARPLGSLGYKQALPGHTRRGHARRSHCRRPAGHRNYAKRQMTWFRREPGVHWIKGFGDEATVQAEAWDLLV